MSDTPDARENAQTSSNTDVTAIKERAERAEQKVEQLEKAVAELKSRETSTQPVQSTQKAPRETGPGLLEGLRAEPMMAHLMDSLEAGKDIGHYGRLVFAMVAHHFLPPEQVLDWLNKDPDLGHDQAIALLRQVEGRDYNPPRRERILAWQAQQEFPIIPDPDDPDCGNVYRNLKFPDKVYGHIQEYQEEKAEAEAS